MKEKYKKIYIDNDEAKSLGLPNRTIGKTIREDGFIFKQYYYNIDNMGFKSKPLELWNSPDAVKRNKIMKAIDKKAVSFRNKKLLKRIKNMFGCSAWQLAQYITHFLISSFKVFVEYCSILDTSRCLSSFII